MTEFVTATTVGLIKGNVLVDLNSAEENAGGAHLLCALFNRSKKVSMLDLDSKIQVASFNALFEEAGDLSRDGLSMTQRLRTREKGVRFPMGLFCHQHSLFLISPFGRVLTGWIFPLYFSVGCRENVSAFWTRFRVIFLYFVEHFCVFKRRAEFIVGLYHFVVL